MQLTEVESLTPAISEQDTNEIGDIATSVLLATPLSSLRWINVKTADARKYQRDATARTFPSFFDTPRITTMPAAGTELPTIEYKEQLVVRDLDLAHAEGSAPTDAPEGHIVAHADYKYVPSFGSGEVRGISEMDPNYPPPPGFVKELNDLLDEKGGKILYDLFASLPCFILEAISTLSPSHLRKGIATRLVKWIYPYADRYALPIILAASPLGQPLYRKCGFDEYREHDVVIDMSGWGGEGVHRHVFMVRWPEELERMPDAWKKWKETHVAG